MRLALALAAVVALLLAWRVAHYDLMVDDAFISFRYAENLIAGDGLVYNPGERVEGFSNPLWTLSIAALHALKVPSPTGALVLAILCAIALLALTWHAARTRLQLEPGWALVAPIVLAMNPSFALWVSGGLETISFGLLLTWAWFEASSDEPSAARVGTATALVVLSRPEGPIWAIAALALVVRKRPAAVVLPALALAGLLAFRLSYYGAWLPAPAYAKAVFGGASLLRGLRYVGSFLLEDGALFLVPLLFIRPLSLPIAVAGAALFAIQSGGDGLYRYRFMVHVMPLIALCAAVAVRARPKRGLVLVALSCVVPFMLPDRVAGYPVEAQRWWEEHWTHVGIALREHTKKGWLATNVAGRLPWASKLPTIDLLGLTDATIAHAPVEGLGTGYAGHERADPAYVLWRRPDLIFFSVLDGEPEEKATDLAAMQQRLGKGPLHRYLPLLASPALREGWRPARLVVDDGSEANVLIRRDSPVARESGRLRLLEWR